MPLPPPKKSLGQNFLTNPSIVKKIVQTAGVTKDDEVLEIGPGRGILTEELATSAKKITAIEIDSLLAQLLKEKFSNTNVEIINTDALKFFPTQENYKIVANIPYYITSPLIAHFLTLKNPPSSMTLMVQKEVAQKICARTPSNPKEKHSILSLQVQLYAKPKIAFNVNKGAFTPMPKVDSSVIHLEPTAKHPKNPEEILSLAKKAFSQKRKKLSNTLREILPKLKELNFQDLRPEHLQIEDWEKLTQ